MINSRYPTEKKFFEQMIKDETNYRDIIKDPNSPYMNIAFDNNDTLLILQFNLINETQFTLKDLFNRKIILLRKIKW